MPIEYIIIFKIIPQSNNMKESNFSRLFDDQEFTELNNELEEERNDNLYNNNKNTN